MRGLIIRLKRWLAPRPATGYVVTLAARDDAEGGFEIDVAVRTTVPEEARDRGLHFAETLMPDIAFRPVAMRQADQRDLGSGETVTQLGPVRHLGLAQDWPAPPSGPAV